MVSTRLREATLTLAVMKHSFSHSELLPINAVLMGQQSDGPVGQLADCFSDIRVKRQEAQPNERVGHRLSH